MWFLNMLTVINTYFVRVIASLYLIMKRENARIRVSRGNHRGEIFVRPEQQQQYSTFS